MISNQKAFFKIIKPNQSKILEITKNLTRHFWSKKKETVANFNLRPFEIRKV